MDMHDGREGNDTRRESTEVSRGDTPASESGPAAAGRRAWYWFAEHAHGAHAKFWLFLISFAESNFFLIPPDPLLAGILLAGSTRWAYYATLTSVASILGAVVGYVVAAFFFDVAGAPVIAFYGLEQEFQVVQSYFDQNTFGVMLFAAFTPIPFKVFVLTAGFLRVDFLLFLLASALGRSARYFLIAFMVHRFGERAISIAKRYSRSVTIAAFVIFAIYIVYTILFG